MKAKRVGGARPGRRAVYPRLSGAAPAIVPLFTPRSYTTRPLFPPGPQPMTAWTLDRARHFGQRAIDAIAGFPNGKAKAALIETVEFAIARGY